MPAVKVTCKCGNTFQAHVDSFNVYYCDVCEEYHELKKEKQVKWIPTRIEELQSFDVVLWNHSVWVIQRVSRNSDGQTFYITRVDDGKQSHVYFSLFSFGYLIEKRVVE